MKQPAKEKQIAKNIFPVIKETQVPQVLEH